MAWLTWSKTQNERSAEKAIAKKELKGVRDDARIEREREKERIERARARQEHLDELAANLANRTDGTTDPVEAVRALVEGDVFTYDDDARLESDRVAELQFTRDQGRTRLIELEPYFIQAWGARAKRLTVGQTTASFGRRPSGRKGSGVGVFLMSAILVGLEVILQRKPMEVLSRHIWPELSSVTALALVLATGLVALSTVSLIFAAQQWADHQVTVERSDQAALNDTGEIVGEDVGAALPWIASIVAIVLQVVLAFLRFRTGTSNDDVRVGLIIASALVAFSAATVALLEYQYARGKAQKTGVPMTQGDDIIDEYLTLHREVHTEIPRAIHEAARRRLNALDRSLRDYQRVAEKKGSDLRQAVATLLREVADAMSRIPDVPFVPPPIPGLDATDSATNGSAQPQDRWKASSPLEDPAV